MLPDYSEKSRQFQTALKNFMDKYIYPNEENYESQLQTSTDRHAKMVLMDELKTKAKTEGLWNLFIQPHHGSFCDHGGLSNLDYYPLAEEMGRITWAAEVFNCNAPDTGNMEVMMNFGSDNQNEH